MIPHDAQKMTPKKPTLKPPKKLTLRAALRLLQREAEEHRAALDDAEAMKRRYESNRR
jgi:hypothetical protein